MAKMADRATIDWRHPTRQLNGRLLYFAYMQVNAQNGIGGDDFESMSPEIQLVWIQLASAIDFEASDELKKSFTNR